MREEVRESPTCRHLRFDRVPDTACNCYLLIFLFFCSDLLACSELWYALVRLVYVCRWRRRAGICFVVSSSMAPIIFVIIAFPCTVGAIALAMLHIYRHLLNYTEPIFQRYIVRIIFMIPVCYFLRWFLVPVVVFVISLFA